MAYDVVVVGGGIGGLTVAALLSARGLNVCLLERQSQVGGCVGRVKFSGLEFEPGMGIYSSFGAGQIYDRVFSELPVELPQTSLLTRPYVVRLADGTDVQLTNDEAFFAELNREFPAVAAALNHPRGPLYEISGGPAALAERLAESIKRSDGTVRLNTPVLRLAYDQTSQAIGVDLLSGETVMATKAIISNLTIWDTYGKLVGLNRTPSETRKLLNTVRGTGAYLIYALIEQAAVSRLPSERMLVMVAEAEDNDFGEFSLAIRGPAATLTWRTDVDEWFTYHTSEEAFEEFDQVVLERCWRSLHARLPELGADIEVAETANPRTFYDQTRRKLGMVMGTQSSGTLLTTHPVSPGSTDLMSFLPNLFMVGDTVTSTPSLDSVTEAALHLANELTK